jgi:hypothetical protein
MYSHANTNITKRLPTIMTRSFFKTFLIVLLSLNLKIFYVVSWLRNEDKFTKTVLKYNNFRSVLFHCPFNK